MIRICSRCEQEISPRRLAAVPTTQLCLSCKSLYDEPKLTSSAPRVAGSLVDHSLSDLAEMQEASRSLVSGE